MDELLLIGRIVAGLVAVGLVTFVLLRQRGAAGLRLPFGMGRLRGTGAAATECPHLGLASDPFTRDARASDEHRCYANLGHERIDLAHQRRFCLASAHNRCPFLTVRPHTPGRGAVLAQARAWWRSVSPAHPVLTAAQLGHSAGLGAAGARGALMKGLGLVLALAVRLAMLMLQAWQTARPQAQPTEQIHLSPGERTAPVRGAHEIERTPDPVIEPLPETEGVQSVEVPEPVLAAVGVQSVEVPEPVLAAVGAPHAELERGIVAVEAGSDIEGYAWFARATQREPSSVHAWFWRAKTAETLDEVVDCLARAHALEPSNTLIASNLDWATARRDASRQAAKSRPRGTPAAAEAPPFARPPGPGLVSRVAHMLLELCRASAALVAFALGIAWLLSALPTQTRAAVMVAAGLPEGLRLPDADRLIALLHVPLGGGYDLGMALPYAIGFLALGVGFGLLYREGWSRLWAPALAVASAWLIAG